MSRPRYRQADVDQLTEALRDWYPAEDREWIRKWRRVIAETQALIDAYRDELPPFPYYTTDNESEAPRI